MTNDKKIFLVSDDREGSIDVFKANGMKCVELTSEELELLKKDLRILIDMDNSYEAFEEAKREKALLKKLEEIL